MADKKPELEVSEASLQQYSADDQSALKIQSLDDIRRLSTIFIGSGMFNKGGNRNQSELLYQAGVKIIAGVEFGIQPFAAMRGINIINGNAEMSANLMAAKVKSHPKYDYRVKEWETDHCIIDFYEIPYPGAPRKDWDLLGPSSFNEEDAKRAGLTGGNWAKFARNMMFARAMSNGVRIYTPDVFYGAPVYVEGEISGEFEEKPKAAPASSQKAVAAKSEAAEGEIVDEKTAQQDAPEEIQDPELQQNLEERFQQVVLDMNGMSLEEVKVQTRELLTDLGYNGKTSLGVANKILGKKVPETLEDYQKIYAHLDLEREDIVAQDGPVDTAAAFAEENENPFLEVDDQNVTEPEAPADKE